MVVRMLGCKRPTSWKSSRLPKRFYVNKQSIPGTRKHGITLASPHFCTQLRKRVERWWSLLNQELHLDEEQEIVREILRYLNKHPDAKDTLDGIAKWWLLREWTERKLVEVKAAVSFLLSKGLVLETRREGMPPYYKLNHQKQEEISTILSQS